ncbi:MAG: hypothetical protein GY863_04110 [bacterium]|nr:hypothetical protein [bacterium]
MSDTPEYLRCRNCDKLIPKTDTFGNWYCSRSCALRFTQCPICGSFFEEGKGAGDFCTPDCAQSNTD